MNERMNKDRLLRILIEYMIINYYRSKNQENSERTQCLLIPRKSIATLASETAVTLLGINFHNFPRNSIGIVSRATSSYDLVQKCDVSAVMKRINYHLFSHPSSPFSGS